MRLPSTLASLLTLLLTSPLQISAATPGRSNKRGLVFTPNSTHPSDNYIWGQEPSDLTWYYNYGAKPSPAFSNLTQDRFEFVPMLWGAPTDLSDTSFLTTVRELVETKGLAITHVMSFNEPDGPHEWGGSDIEPSIAAKLWISNIMPLQEMGLKVGLPAPTGGWGGIPWLNQFLGNCSMMISSGRNKQNCTYDFVPIHWYGNFGGLASHIGTYAAAFPGTPIWVTEYNYNDQSLDETQGFFNMSAEYMDRIEEVERYSLFAAFRSDVSNVGPNATMLSAGGKLTDIGAWYLGREATGVLPQSKDGLSPAGRVWNEFVPKYAVAMAAVAVAAVVGL